MASITTSSLLSSLLLPSLTPSHSSSRQHSVYRLWNCTRIVQSKLQKNRRDRALRNEGWGQWQGVGQVERWIGIMWDISTLLHSWSWCLYLKTSRKHTIHMATGFGTGTEKSFKTTVEIDRLIDNLRRSEYQKKCQVVAENVLAFDATFWLRLAARADLCKSGDDRTEYEELATQIMTIVELIVRKTKEQIESSTDILKSIINPLIESNGEILWPPRSRESIIGMRKEVDKRQKENFLDENFLSEVSAQLRQAKEDKDKPGLVAILQKVLQLYAAGILSKRSYAVKDGDVDKAEELLERVIAGDEDEWDDLLRSSLTYGGGEVQFEELFTAIDRRIERTLMRTGNGTYQQRILAEYIREIETRAHALSAAFQGAPPKS